MDLNNLYKLMDYDEDRVKKIIDLFKEGASTKVREIKIYFEENDWQQVSILAHTLKTHCKYLGVSDLIVLSSKIEMAAENSMNLHLIPAWIDLLETGIKKTLEELDSV